MPTQKTATADAYGIVFVYHLCSYLPALGLVAWLLPNLERGHLRRAA